jgi:hypothetical protein
MLPHFLDSRLTDGGEVVSLKRRPPFTPHEDSWYSFLLEAESNQGHSAAGRVKSIEKFNGRIENRTRLNQLRYKVMIILRPKKQVNEGLEIST